MYKKLKTKERLLRNLEKCIFCNHKRETNEFYDLWGLIE